jgi:hypothetical protein
MNRTVSLLAAAVAIVGLVAANSFAFAPSEDRRQAHGRLSKGKQQHTDYSGKALLGDKIRKNGPHKLHDHGKYIASVSVFNGKITGLHVEHADSGAVPVTIYKTTTNMARGATSSVQFASYLVALSQNIGTMWIGYGYLDEWGDEFVYWFPYDMNDAGDAGAIEYSPAH